MSVGVIRKVSEDEVRERLDDIASWNEYIKIGNVSKHFGLDSVIWYALFANKREMVALAAVAKDKHYSPIRREVFINQLCAKSGHGYGKALVNGLYNMFNKRHSEGMNCFGFTADPEAKPGLIEYYRKWFNEETGWKSFKTRMGWDHFQKKFTEGGV